MKPAPTIAFLVSYPYQDNAQLRKETKALLDHGFRVHVYAWDRRGTLPAQQKIDRLEITNIASSGTFSRGGILQGMRTLAFWFKAFCTLLRAEFDALQCQDLNTVLPGLLACRLRRRPVIFDAHDPYPEMFELSQPGYILAIMRGLEKFLSRRVDTIITVNELMAARFRELTPRPVTILYNYPEKTLFSAGEEKRGTDTGIVLGRIGTIQPDTGIEELVEALDQVRDLSPELLLVGGVTPNFSREFERLMQGINTRVTVTGFIPPTEVVAYYRAMDISVMLYHPTPIFRYISPMKLFESMAMGVPVIASDVGEIRQVVEAYKCGVVVPENSGRALAQAIRELAGDPEKRRAMGANGMRAIQETMNWEQERMKLVELYRRLIGEQQA